MQVHTLRVEVQRLQVKVQEAEARASASQRIAEEAQRELQAVMAASNSPVAGQARQAMDAEKALLRQQLLVRRPSAPAHSAIYTRCTLKRGWFLCHCAHLLLLPASVRWPAKAWCSRLQTMFWGYKHGSDRPQRASRHMRRLERHHQAC